MSDEDTKTEQSKDLFDDLGLSIQFSDVTLGQTYPIYGMITKFISDAPGNVIVVINENIEATMNVEDEAKIETLKNRSFESGIFVCTITDAGSPIKADCSTVIFGKNNNAVQ